MRARARIAEALFAFSRAKRIATSRVRAASSHIVRTRIAVRDYDYARPRSYVPEYLSFELENRAFRGIDPRIGATRIDPLSGSRGLATMEFPAAIFFRRVLLRAARRRVARASRRLFYFAKMRVYGLSRGEGEERSFVSLWSESGPGAVAERARDVVAGVPEAARLLLGRHEEVRSDNNEFRSVVPFALRVARVVKSVDAETPLPVRPALQTLRRPPAFAPSPSLPPLRLSVGAFFLRGDVDDRVKFLLRQRACVSRARGLALYGAAPDERREGRKNEKEAFTWYRRDYVPSTLHPSRICIGSSRRTARRCLLVYVYARRLREK